MLTCFVAICSYLPLRIEDGAGPHPPHIEGRGVPSGAASNLAVIQTPEVSTATEAGACALPVSYVGLVLEACMHAAVTSKLL